MKRLLLISSGALIIAGIPGCGSLELKSENKVKVKVKCHYMAYACGECFPNRYGDCKVCYML